MQVIMIQCTPGLSVYNYKVKYCFSFQFVKIKLFFKAYIIKTSIVYVYKMYLVSAEQQGCRVVSGHPCFPPLTASEAEGS